MLGHGSNRVHALLSIKWMSVLYAAIGGGILGGFFIGLGAFAAHQRSKKMRKDLDAFVKIRQLIDEMPDDGKPI